LSDFVAGAPAAAAVHVCVFGVFVAAALGEQAFVGGGTSEDVGAVGVGSIAGAGVRAAS
jgi:hypothetical protein